MPAPLSLDLRRRILAALEAGASQRQVAKRFQVGLATVERLVRRVRLTGSPAPKPRGGGRRATVAETDRELILRWVQAEPDLTQAEMAGRFGALGRPVSQQAVSRGLRRLGVTRKKR